MTEQSSANDVTTLQADFPFAPGESPFQSKGMLWMGIRAFMEAKIPGGVAAVSADLTPPFAEFLSQEFLPTAFYDVMPILTIAHAAARAMNVDTMEYVRRAAVLHAEHDMTGVYKALLALRSPLAVCKRFGSLHSQIHGFGKALILREEPSRVEATATGMPEPLAWWWKRATEHYIVTVLRAAGAKNPRMAWQPQQADGMRAGVALVKLPSFTTRT